MTQDEDKILFPRSYANAIEKLIEDVRRLKSSKPLTVTSLDQITPVAGDLVGSTLWITDPETSIVRGIWTSNPREETGNYHQVFYTPEGIISVGIDADTGELFAGLGNVLLGPNGIYAILGTIGGWTLGVDYLRSDGGGVGLSSIVSGGDDVRFFAGDPDPDSAPFRVHESGLLVASNAIIEGDISASTGNIGGWIVTSTDIRKLSGATGIIIDSVTPKIQVGNTAGTHIVIDGANQQIKSSNYASGASGFFIESNTGDAEFNNISARGKIRTAVFEKDTVSSVGGQLLVLDSDVLASDMSALDSAALVIEGNTTFAVNDILRMKDGTDDEWFKVTSIASAPSYAVERDKAAVYAANNNPTWKKGQAVVNYGPSGSGGVSLAGGATPAVTVFTHSGTPWASVAINTLLSETVFAVGSDLSAVSTTSFVVFPVAQTYNSESMGAGDILIGSNSVGNVFYDASENKLKFRSGTTVRAYIDANGTITAGGGTIVMDEEAITLTATEFPGAANLIKWIDADDAVIGEVVNQYVDGFGVNIWLNSIKREATDVSLVTLMTSAVGGEGATDVHTTLELSSVGNATFDFEDGTSKAVNTQYLDILVVSNDPNSPTTAFYLSAKTNATLANGFGVAMAYWLQNSGGGKVQAGYTDILWLDKTATSEDAQFNVGLKVAGTETTVMSVDGTNGVQSPFGVKVGSGTSLVGKIDYGDYTPTLNNTTNVTGSTAFATQWFRIHDYVYVFGKCEIDPTAASVATELGISLPVASDLSAERDLAGTAACHQVAGYSASVLADVTNNRARVRFVCGTDIANRTWSFHFGYTVK